MPQTVNIKGLGQVRFPDEMSPEQIQSAIESEILPHTRAQAKTPEYPTEGPTFAARVGRGAMDIYQGATQRILQLASLPPQGMPSIQELRAYASPDEQKLSDDELRAKFKSIDIVKDYTDKVNDEIANYQKGRQAQGAGKFDGARIFGNAAAAAPLALAGPGGTSVLARAGQGAIGGASSGALTFNPSGRLKDAAVNAAFGGIIGMFANPIIGAGTDLAGAGIRRLIGAARGSAAQGGGRATGAAATSSDQIVQQVPEIGQLAGQPRDAMLNEARDQILKTGALNAEQLGRKANLIAQGVMPTRSMVTRSASDWTQERNLQKLAVNNDEALGGLGQEMTNLFVRNDQALGNRLRAFSPGSGTLEAQGQTVMRSLDDLAEASQKEVSKIYQTVRETQGENLASDARQIASTLDDLKDSTYAANLVTSVTNRLRRFGMVDKEGNLTNKTLTVTQAEELRKFVNRLPNDYGKPDIIRAIDADVLSGAGADAFAVARKAASDRFSMLENAATQRALRSVGELSEGKTAQNFIKSQVVDGSTKDVTELVATIDRIPDIAKRAEAIDALRTGVVRYLQNRAINESSGRFSGASLASAIRDIGEEKLIRVMGPAQFQELQGLSRAALDATYEPAYAAVNTSNSAPALARWISRYRAIPVLNLLAPDALERGAARLGYAGQLNRAVAARADIPLPPVPVGIQGMLGATPAYAPLPLVGALGTYQREPQ